MRMRYLGLLGTDRLAQTGDAQAERRRQADLAIESLRAAVAAGFNDLGQLQDNRDLQPLRERPDFKELVARMALAGSTGASAKARLAGSEASPRLPGETSSSPSDGNASGCAHRVIRVEEAASLYAIGLIQFGLGDMDEAAKSLEQALSLRESLAESDRGLATILTQLAQIHLAKGENEPGLGPLEPGNRGHIRRLAALRTLRAPWRRLTREDAVPSRTGRGLQCAGPGLRQFAPVGQQLGRVDRAQHELTRSIEENPEDPQPWVDRAFFYIRGARGVAGGLRRPPGLDPGPRGR